MLPLVLAVGACTSEAPILPDDPCALVSPADVEAATDSTVTRSGPIPDWRKRLATDRDPNPCEYVTDGEHGSIAVYVDPHGAADFTRMRDKDPVNSEAIDGLGDEAFVFGLAVLYVRVAGGYFAMKTQHGAGWPGVRDLEDLARAALD